MGSRYCLTKSLICIIEYMNVYLFYLLFSLGINHPQMNEYNMFCWKEHVVSQDPNMDVQGLESIFKRTYLVKQKQVSQRFYCGMSRGRSEYLIYPAKKVKAEVWKRFGYREKKYLDPSRHKLYYQDCRVSEVVFSSAKHLRVGKVALDGMSKEGLEQALRPYRIRIDHLTGIYYFYRWHSHMYYALQFAYDEQDILQTVTFYPSR